MNEENKHSNPSSKCKKVSEVGLSKKERRAQRVAQKPDNSNKLPEQTFVKNALDNHTKQVIKSKPSPKQIQSNLAVSTVTEQHDTLGNKSKAASKVEKQGTQERQRAPKLNSEESDKLAKEKSSVKSSCESLEVKENGETPSKAQLKAERRALQEKQRLAKAVVKPEQENKKEPQASVSLKAAIKKSIILKSEPLNEHQVNLCNHLYYSSFTNESKAVVSGVHSSFIRLGVQYSSKTILGSNARCLALLSALKDLINDFITPPKQEFCRSLEVALQKCVLHLQQCRPFAVSMTNTLRHFKLLLTQINTNWDDDDKKADLLLSLDVYKEEQIAKAGEAISMKVNEKITSDDIIVTYGCSSLIRRLLLDAHKNGKKFKVIVIDSRPLLEGREMLRVLISHGIDCTYVLINSVSFIMSKATKVLLGAHALLANGYVMSRTGTAQIALIAQAYSKPVLVCCETYKFCERVQTDCFVYNEIGDPDKLVTVDTLEQESPLLKWRNSKYLTPLNLLYDITPTDLVTAVVTELGFLPCTSVPVVLRIKPME